MGCVVAVWTNGTCEIGKFIIDENEKSGGMNEHTVVSGSYDQG